MFFFLKKDNIIKELKNLTFKTGIISNVGNNKLEQRREILPEFSSYVL